MHNEKAECLASTYKSGFLRGKLLKRTMYILGNLFHTFFFCECEFISYLLNHLFHILTKNNNNNNKYILLVLF